jgi:hypothetical protein
MPPARDRGHAEQAHPRRAAPCGQKIQVGLVHAGKTAEVTVEADTYQITV